MLTTSKINTFSVRKRSRINLQHWRKQPSFSRLVVAIGAAGLSACSDDNRRDVYIATDPYNCSQNTGLGFEQCELAYRKALLEAQQTAPRYRTLDDCRAEFGYYSCDPEENSSTSSSSASGGSGGGSGGGYKSSDNNGRSYGTTGKTVSAPEYFPRMTGFIVDTSNPKATQAFNPVFTHTDPATGRMALATADAEPLRAGKNGLMRAEPRYITGNVTAIQPGKTISRGGFGTRMAMRAGFGG
jgi:uncharacterized protein YgiB involved in biofilm formation